MATENPAPQTTQAAAFGLEPNAGTDATPLLAHALEALSDGATLRLAPGDYHFWPERARRRFYHLCNNQAGFKPIACPLLERENLTLEGNGARFIFHGEILPFAIDGGANITIRDLTLDWHRPFFSQGEIIAGDRESVDIRLDPERYPHEIVDGALIFTGEGWRHGFTEGIFEMDTRLRRPAYLSGDNLAGHFAREGNARSLGDGKIRLSGRFGRAAAPGNALVLRHYRRHFPAVFLKDTRDARLENIRVRHAGGSAILGQFCDNITVANCEVRPDADSDRLFSATADAAHFVNCTGCVTLDACAFARQLDDAANIHGIHYRVEETLDRKSAMLALGHFEQRGAPVGSPGDEVVFRDADTLLERDRDRIAGIEEVDEWRRRVRFEKPLADGAGTAVVENLTRTPEIRITGGDFRDNRARGLLLSSPRPTLVRANRIAPAGAAIKISGDANYWFEAGAVRDVRVEANTFGPCCYGPPEWGRCPIDIDPEIDNPWAAEGRMHEGIRITGNTFRVFDAGVLYARSASRVLFRDNRIEPSDAYPPTGRTDARLTFDACDVPATDGNQVENGTPSIEFNDRPNDRHKVRPQAHLDDPSAGAA